MHGLVGPDQAILKYSTEYVNFDPAVPTKAGYKWLPIVDERVGTASPLRTEQMELVVEEARIVRRYNQVLVPAATQVTAIKDECRRRILARFPDWKQTNMNARGVELQDIWRKNGSWTEAEQADAAALTAAWEWVKATRAASNALEAMSPIPEDFTADGYWPA